MSGAADAHFGVRARLIKARLASLRPSDVWSGAPVNPSLFVMVTYLPRRASIA